MQNLYIDLSCYSGIAYLVDHLGIIVSASQDFYELFKLSEGDTVGKTLEQCGLLEGYALDQSNIRFLQSDFKYLESHELLQSPHNNAGIFVLSRKRKILSQGQAIGILNNSVPLDHITEYKPEKIFNISNTQIGLQLRENLNALYAIKVQIQKVQKVGYSLEQHYFMSALQDLLDKMRVTMDGIVLSNDKCNNSQAIAEVKIYETIYIGSQNYNFTSRIFKCISSTLSEFSKSIELQKQVKRGYFAVIYLDQGSYPYFAKVLGEKSLDKITTMNTLLIVLGDSIEGDIMCKPPSITNNIDAEIYPLWRQHIYNVIKATIKANDNIFILSVEDDPDSQDAMCNLLEGYEQIKIVRASSGARAIQEVSQRYYDLIILDINLGDISGFEVAREIRYAQHRACFTQSILYVNTGYDYSEKINVDHLGIDAIYLKPYLMMELNQIINNLLST